MKGQDGEQRDCPKPQAEQTGPWVRLKSWARSWGADLLLIVGAGCIAAGVGWIYSPAGLIAGGVLLIAGGVLWAKGGDSP